MRALAILFKQIEERNYSLIRFIALTIATLFFCLTVLQLYYAYELKDYRTVPAYIDHISSKERYTSKSVRTEYTYDVHWTYNGKEHVTTIDSAIDKPDENLSEVRVNPSTGQMSMGSSKGSIKGCTLTSGIALASFLVWLFFLIISENRRKEILENCNLAIVMGIVALPITGFCTYSTNSDARYARSVLTMVVLDLLFGIMLAAGILLKVKMKRRNK